MRVIARLGLAAAAYAIAVAVIAGLRLPPQDAWAYLAVAVAATALLAFVARTRELAARAEELQRLNRQLSESSVADSLTGLRNRRFAFEHVGPDLTASTEALLQARRRGDTVPEATAVLFLVDLDHFKAINDTLGHRIGDEVLVEVAGRLRRAVRAEDTVIRWGGDELLVVTRDTSPDAGAAMAERLRRAVAEPAVRVSTGADVPLTCTVGFACYPFLPSAPAAGTWEDVVGFADFALYAAKRQGRDSWAGCVARASATREVFAQLRSASEALLTRRLVELRHGERPAA